MLGLKCLPFTLLIGLSGLTAPLVITQNIIILKITGSGRFTVPFGSNNTSNTIVATGGGADGNAGASGSHGGGFARQLAAGKLTNGFIIAAFADMYNRLGSRIFGSRLGREEQKAVAQLRNSSHTAKLIIDTLANSKTRYFIDFTSGYAGSSGAETRLPPWYPISDWGIKINPEDIKESLWEDTKGNFFQPDLLRVLSHELAHLFIYDQNISPTHASGPFAHSDEAIWYENQISLERGILPGYTYVPERVLDHFKWITPYQF